MQSNTHRTKGRGFDECINTKMKQNKINVTPEKDNMTSANQTPGVSSAKSYDCDTLLSQVPVRKMEHGSTVEIRLLLLDSSN